MKKIIFVLLVGAMIAAPFGAMAQQRTTGGGRPSVVNNGGHSRSEYIKMLQDILAQFKILLASLLADDQGNTNDCAVEGSYSSGSVSPEFQKPCCSGLVGMNTRPGLVGGGLLCYTPSKGVPYCKDGTGWYYANGVLLKAETCPTVPTADLPVITDIFGPGSLTVGNSGTWTVMAKSPASYPLSYSVNWNCDDNSSCTETNTTGYFTKNYSVAGTYNPVFTVSDGAGTHPGSVSRATTIRVVPAETIPPTDTKSITVSSPAAGSTYQENKSMTVIWTSKNVGPNEPLYLVLQQNGTDVVDRVIGLMRAITTNSNQSYSFNVPDSLDPGSGYSIKLMSFDGSVQGSSGQFTIAAPDLTAASKPDLTPTAFFPVINQAKKGDTIRFSPGIVNVGMAANGAFLAQWSVDGVVKDSKTLGGDLSVGVERKAAYPFDWVATTTGIHTITFSLDPDNKISESNEDNNVAQYSVTVAP